MIVRHHGFGWAVLSAALLLAEGAAAEPQDAQAERALRAALEEDYLETRFDDAENKLLAAIKACGDDKCSRGLLAKLHAALGSVLAGGKKELEDARDEFVAALVLDPKIEPNPDIASASVTFSFEQAQKKLHLGGPAGASSGQKSKPSPYDDGGTDAEPAGKPGTRRDESTTSRPVRPRRNWFELSFLTDLSVVSGANVCHKDVRAPEHFVCLRQADGVRYVGNPTLDVGDTLNAGIGLSTLRLLLGYDRVLGQNFTVGARIGFAFNGASGDKVSFQPFHVEGRVAYYPRSNTFTDALVRPYVMMAAGLAQIDTKVSDVEVLEDGALCGAADPMDPMSPCAENNKDVINGQRKQTLTVYKQAGLGFAVLSGGIELAPVPNFAIRMGLRGGVTFPALSAVFSPELGVSVGF